MSWISFEPSLSERDLKAFVQAARQVARRGVRDAAECRQELLTSGSRPTSTEEICLHLARSLLVDLLGQGWRVRVRQGKVSIKEPSSETETPEETKERIRQAHLVERDLQLQEESVQTFIREMEQRRLTKTGWHSIFSLMRDGRDLAESLERARALDSADPFASAVAPYLQFVEPGAVCEYTGLRLGDVWRYFRLTWVNAYRSLPGRTMLILVRDAAAQNHPVIGIAALGSSVVQQESRDKWIGWATESFLAGLPARSPASVLRWIRGKLEAQTRALFIEDLIDEKLIQPHDLKQPHSEVIDRLRKEAKAARDLHRRNPRAADHRARQKDVSGGWLEAARTGLFRSKRCEALARLLSIRMALAGYLPSRGQRLDVGEMLSSSSARAALGQLVRLVKGQHVGIDMMDITVCGAIAPYNQVLGGKLVCMLLASHELVEQYKRRYGNQVSVIASSVKGEAVRRPPRLVVLGTTSLYGVGSSQYNRVRVPCAEIGGRADEKVEYKRLGLSKGYGSFHLSALTIELADLLVARRKGGRQVNSIFGEGVNPLLRKIREALEFLGLPSDRVLNHGSPRVVYGVALARNFREILLGFEDLPDYLLPGNDPHSCTTGLAAFWRRRWLTQRATKREILDAIRGHTLAYPVTHGARVPFSAPVDQEQLELLHFSLGEP